jgi:hypothetical protein
VAQGSEYGRSEIELANSHPHRKSFCRAEIVENMPKRVVPQNPPLCADKRVAAPCRAGARVRLTIGMRLPIRPAVKVFSCRILFGLIMLQEDAPA